MNPQNPYYNNPSFYFHPPPIPNYQNPNYSHPHQNHYHHHQQQQQPILPPNPSSSSTAFTTTKDPNTTLSILKDFINQAKSTLKSLPDQITLKNSPDEFCCCPFNPNHKMLPEFLFHHFLICTSSPCVIDLDMLDSLHYPKSIKEIKNESIQPIEESNDEICISIDDYLLDFRSNFFYKDCPAVVCSSDFDSNGRTFKLPRVLYKLCSDFTDEEEDTKVERRECMKILPSELWVMRTEIEVWHEFPVLYSYLVSTVCRCLGFAKECEILKWIIMNSPRYGIVIDLHMRDHIYMLLKLCVKAIEREANRTHKLMLTGNEGDRELDFKSLRFDCPVLLEVMMWLSSQFTVLYGQVNGKLFSKELLKWCLLNAASSSLLCPLNEKEGTVCGKEGLDSGCVNDGKDLELVGSIASGNVKLEIPDEKFNAEVSIYESSVFVSQVTAAVAALHERALLEEKIKGLRLAGSLPRSQLLKEHLYVSTRAIEERGKRPNYRPILEHDGLLWQRYQNKDSNKSKTREELLAEERDYKRRRMSYRGKKVKRSKTEVLRDIIEVHMNEIEQAGGIGCFVKGSAEAEGVPSGTISVNNMPVVDMLTSSRKSSEPRNRPEYGYEKQSYPHHSVSARSEFVTPKDHLSRSSDVTHSHSEQGFESSHGQQDQERSIRKDKQDKEYRCRSPENYKSQRSYERHRHHRERDDQEESGTSARKELGTPKDSISRSSDTKHSHARQGHESYGHRESEDRKRSIRKNKEDKEYRSRSPDSYRSRGSHERHRHQRERDDREGSRSSKYDKGCSVSSHRSRYHDSRSTSSVSNPASDLSEGKNDQISDINGYNKRRTSERYRSESVRENVIEDRYDPSGSNNGYEDANDDPSSHTQYARPDKSYDSK
ncbi:U11/U12 small nuclear ribonucleoprotein 48 kDa protein-like [Papaver somniferum]|uniref:U11/U12 small nuclear ribonucleoprotein 48 kDa protein-like n=1 Tax=Papaver somniferum TaxID=3469 RepID=UPI000E6F5CD0|nr:U11/U12 small nuclear ribonucleoprotein 48 kDa protein-like [Papaver somniferum]XP_026387741.1 U11/U12 small nuclear ribonucleoprotein 48 kDa protein-like [Papaver somniferum]XP_026387743.1 U11/U12 small nuclear ribonucleoprotein 48 kDa protein-like [Papaver somniferum]